MNAGQGTRAFFFGTTALVALSIPVIAADFDIGADTAQNQVLIANETGNVQATFTLSAGTATLPTVSIIGSSATLTNSGTISNTGTTAVSVSGTITGVSITNSGTITGGTIGILVDTSSDISGGITNSGTITGGFAGIFVDTSSDISGGIINSGTISGNTFGIHVDDTSDISGGVNNSGTILGGIIGVTFGVGINVEDGSDISGGITNSGTIVGGVAGNTFGAGIRVDTGSDISGGVTNSGTISGATLGIFVDTSSDISGGITNSGTISGGNIGIHVDTSSDISGGITNSGTIVGGVAGNTFAFGINVDDGSDISGGITNSGTIVGGGFAGNTFGAGIRSDTGSDISGGVTNSGTISGLNFGIFVDTSSDISGGVTNSGTILGGSIGILVSDTSDISGGITNSGTISGGSTGIFVSTNSMISGGVVNSGTIAGLGGTSVQLGGGAETLTLQTGSVLVGAADGGGGDDMVILEGTGVEDDNFTSFEQLNMNGTDWDLSGTVALLAGGLGGTANVNTGLLSINGTLTAPGGVVVAPGAALGGSGTITALVSNSGSVAPGNSVGTLTVSGSVAFSAGSTYDVETQGMTTDLLNVIGAPGTVTIDPAAAMTVTPLGEPVDVKNQPVITAVSGIDANFTTVTATGGTAATSALVGNQILLTTAGPSTVNASVRGATNDGFIFQRAISRESRAGLHDPDKRLWARGLAEFIDRDPSEGSDGFDQDVYGVALGGDIEVAENLRLGAALGYTKSDVDLDTSGGDEIDSLQVGAYGNYIIKEFIVHFGVQGGFQEHDVERAVLSSGVMTKGTADPDGSLLGAYVGIGRDFPIDENWTVQPYGQIAYLHQSQDSYTDSLGLRIDDTNTDTLRAGLTLEIQGQFTGDSVSFMPRGHLGFESQLALDDRETDVRFSDGTTGTVSLDDDADHFVTLGGGVTAVFANGIEVFVDFDGAFSDDETRYGGFAGFRIRL